MNTLNRNYINGRWVAWDGDMIDVHEAATGEVIARVPAAGAAEMDQAVAAGVMVISGVRGDRRMAYPVD